MYWGNDRAFIAITYLWYYIVFGFFHLSIVYHHIFQLHFSFSFRHIQLDIQILLYINFTLHLGAEPLNEQLLDLDDDGY